MPVKKGFTLHLKSCRKCGQAFKTPHRYPRKCPDCKISNGRYSNLSCKVCGKMISFVGYNRLFCSVVCSMKDLESYLNK